jgi:hypothetical protein
MDSVHKLHQSRCPKCGGPGPIDVFTSHTVWSVVIMAQWKNQPRAEVMAADLCEDEVHRRAIEGVWKRTGWHKGEPGGFVREYSGLLLIFKKKAMLPDKYRDRIELRGSLSTLDYSRLTDEQLARIASGEHPLAVLSAGVPRPLLPAPKPVEE